MKRKATKALIAEMVLMSSLSLVWARQGADASQNPPAADNTKTNQRDQNASEPTADKQKENPTDRQLTQQIRRALIKDKSLSTNAHNIKVIAQDGAVTLKGPVRSAEEKTAVEAKATEAAGAGKVTNELTIAAKKDKGSS